MKLKTLITLFFIFFSLNFVNSQTKVKGLILEKNAINAIAYATIKHDNEFITADEKGAFFLTYKGPITIIDSILISCIGYKNKKIGVLANLKESTLNIELEQSVYLLNEVLVKSFKLETDPKVIFKKFAAKFSNKINDKPFDSKTLYREFSLQDNLYMDYVEAIGLMHFEGNPQERYASVTDVSILNIFENIRGINSRLLTTANTGYHPLIWQMAANHVELNLYWYLLYNFIDDIDLKLIKTLADEESKTYVIEFSPSKKNWGTPINVYSFISGSSGTIYLDANDYSVKKIEFRHDEIDKKIKLKVSKYKNQIKGISGVINYIQIDGRSIPSYISYNYYFSDIKLDTDIKKRMQYFFSHYSFDNQDKKSLENRYKTIIKKEYPFRSMAFNPLFKFSGNPIFNPNYWKNTTEFPLFWDIDKVKSDLKKQGLDLEDEFKKFTNNTKN